MVTALKQVSILVPDFHHAAIEERHGFEQSALLFARELPGSAVVRYDSDDSARVIANNIVPGLVLVITDPLALPVPGCGVALIKALSSDTNHFSIPVTNESPNPVQVIPPSEAYLTLGQLQRIDVSSAGPETVPWASGNPGVFACATGTLAEIDRPLADALVDVRVSLVHQARVHRFPTHRGQARADLLERIPQSAERILEFGCGEGALGAALKQRQNCHVMGIELDEDAARIARQRIDKVEIGDVRAIISDLDQTFDWIVGGDILEHIDDPWSFLSLLKKVAAPGGRLILSLPNVGHAAVVGDILRGRFDYVFLGILSAGHLRFFTKQTIRDLLDISGWREVSIDPHGRISTAAERELVEALERCDSIPFSAVDLQAPGYYVVAEVD